MGNNCVGSRASQSIWYLTHPTDCLLHHKNNHARKELPVFNQDFSTTALHPQNMPPEPVMMAKEEKYSNKLPPRPPRPRPTRPPPPPPPLVKEEELKEKVVLSSQQLEDRTKVVPLPDQSHLRPQPVKEELLEECRAPNPKQESIQAYLNNHQREESELVQQSSSPNPKQESIQAYLNNHEREDSRQQQPIISPNPKQEPIQAYMQDHQREEGKPTRLISGVEEEKKSEVTQKPRKPHNVTRLCSVGLRLESVLKTKTGHIKEFYSLGKKLGHGQFGTTFLCIEKGTGKQYACKSIAKRKLATMEDVEDVRREIQIMHHLSGHPNVISIKGAYEDAVAVHVVMEFCAGGELFERIIKRGHYSERKAAKLTRTIVGVIEACHSLGVMHRDLKPENFLFVNEEEDSLLKAIDFGLSMFFKPGEIFTDVVGSPYYVAPEVLKKRYGPEADVWSAGVIVYILLSGVPPFWAETEQEIFEEVLHGDLDFTSDPWPNISESAKDLVRRMLVRDPRKRMTVHEVLCHPWVRDEGVAPDKPLDPAVLSRMKQFSAMNKLKKMALRVIAENLSEEEIAGLTEMFKMIDTDNSGHITFEELKVGLKKFGANLNECEIYDLMQAADIDNSGTIDYGEFIAATLHLNKVEKEDHLLAAFSYFDKDGSGYITLDELQEACVEFGMEDVHLEELIREADQDNDGRIDYKEFVAMMQGGNSETGASGRQGKNFSIGFRSEVLQVC